MSGSWRTLAGPAGALCIHTTGLPDASPVVVLCHELPRDKGGAAVVGGNTPALADRLKQETGWRVVAVNLRGVGGSEGDFSAAGWLEDLSFALATEVGSKGRICLAGFGLGGALALRFAAGDRRVRGVATFGTPSSLEAWVGRPDELVAQCRLSGAISTPTFPADVERWAAEVIALEPLAAVAALGGRSLLVVHGSDDPDVPPSAAQQLAGAVSGNGAESGGEPGVGTGVVDLRVLPGAGHWLRADPRMVATLIGWLERQR